MSIWLMVNKLSRRVWGLDGVRLQTVCGYDHTTQWSGNRFANSKERSVVVSRNQWRGEARDGSRFFDDRLGDLSYVERDCGGALPKACGEKQKHRRLAHDECA